MPTMNAISAGGHHRAEQPTMNGRPKPPRWLAYGGPQRIAKRVGADREEAGDADVEETGVAPLQVQPEADDAKISAMDQEEHEVRDDAASSTRFAEQALRRRHSRIRSISVKPTAGVYCGADHGTETGSRRGR